MITQPVDFESKSDEIWAFLDKRKKLLDGVVITGGEPSLHPGIITDLVPELRAMGYKLKLDSNGLNPAFVEQFAPDYFAMDLKTSPQFYGKLLKAPFDDIEDRLNRSLAVVKSMSDKAEIRITCAPGIFGVEDARNILSMLSGVQKVFLQPVNLRNKILVPEFFVEIEETADDLYLEEIRAEIATVVPQVSIRGRNKEDAKFAGLG